MCMKLATMVRTMKENLQETIFSKTYSLNPFMENNSMSCLKMAITPEFQIIKSQPFFKIEFEIFKEWPF